MILETPEKAFSAPWDFRDPPKLQPSRITEVNTRPRVGYIDLLETQIKMERNKGRGWGTLTTGPMAAWERVLVLVIPALEPPSCGHQGDFFLG